MPTTNEASILESGLADHRREAVRSKRDWSGRNATGEQVWITPWELQRRQERCRSVVTKLLETGTLFVWECNVCGSARSAVVSKSDRYGFPVRTALCLSCGLYYLADRLTDEGYRVFYESGAYRELTGAFNPVGIQSASEIRHSQEEYARRLIAGFDGYIRKPPGARLLDVGGGQGNVAAQFRDAYGYHCTVVDPAAEEIAVAQSLGLEGIAARFERWEPKTSFDMVLFCRSIEHVQDLRGTMSKIRRLMSPDAYLLCDIVDFEMHCRLMGHPGVVSKIDHCYWLTRQSAENIFSALGFSILNMHLDMGLGAVAYLLAPSPPAAVTEIDARATQARLEEMNDHAAKWTQQAEPVTAKTWLRHKAYRFKRSMQRSLGPRA